MKTIRLIGLGLLLFTLIARAIVGMVYDELPWWIPLVSVPMFIVSIVMYIVGSIYTVLKSS